MDNPFVLLTMESGAAWFLSLVITYATFWIYNNIPFVQRVILPGRDEAEAVDDYLSTTHVQKWTNKEFQAFHSLSVRDAARIVAAAFYFYTIVQLISPLF